MTCVPTFLLSRTHTKEKTGVLRAERLRDADATDDAFHNVMAAPAQQVDVRVEPGDSMPGAMLWEVGRTKTCKTRTDAPATFGNMCAARARDASR